MKSLKNYFQELHVVLKDNTANSVENKAMRTLKKYAQVDLNGSEGLYETNIDRWSRNAKHHLAKSELAGAVDLPIFEKGDKVIYEGKEVQVKIPQGPKGTTGIMFEGHLKMVHQSKLEKIEEGILGGMQSLNPLNRIMQLAGLEHTGAIETIEETEVLTEGDAASMLSQLVTTAQNMPQYKGNEEAARLFVIGSILSEIFKNISNNKLQTVAGQSKMTALNSLGAMGADLIKTSQTLAQGQSTGTPAAQTQGQTLK